MRACEPFQCDDLEQLDGLLGRADAVVSMREIHAGAHGRQVIGLRHDMDNMFRPSLELARWEHDRGYRATYFVLHDAPYWDDPGLRDGLEEIASLGHEIGIHANAIAEALRTGGDQHGILENAVGRLRSWGHRVTGVAAHGDPLCHRAGFVNDEQFVECARPDQGAPDRLLRLNGHRVRIEPRPLAAYGLEYETLRVGDRRLYLSDSGGAWNVRWDDLCSMFPHPDGQLHILMHPCWWEQAFTAVAA